MSTSAELVSAQGVPSAVDLEQFLLGSILLCPDLIYEAGSKLRADDFLPEEHRRIFATMLSLSDQRIPVDIFSVIQTMQSRSLLGINGGDYIGSLPGSAVRKTNVAYFCKIIKAKSVLRALLRLSELVGQQAQAPDADPAEIIASVQELTLDMQSSGSQFRHIGEVMTEAVAKLAELRSAPSEGIPGLTTTIDDLDMATTGIRDSEFWVIGARPNVGKTPFGMQVAIAQAKQGIPVLVFSLEMQDLQLACRCLSHAGIARPRSVRDPKHADESQWARIQSAPERFSRMTGNKHDYPLYIDDTPDLTIKQLRHIARYAVAKHGVKLIVVDYLQLVQGVGKSEYEQVTSVSKGLRWLVRETKCPVLALSQLNREAKDLSVAPNLADLRSSGAIEQDANVVVFLHRPPDPDSDKDALNLKGKAIAAKLREGIGGAIDIGFDVETLTFRGGWNR
jgi:replicative DNA helicase